MTTETRTTRRFDWDTVDSTLVRELLIRVYEAQDRTDEVDRFRLRGRDELSAEQLRRQAHHALGSPPAKRYFDDPEFVDIIRTRWLPKASSKTLKSLTTMVQARLTGENRTRVLRTNHERIEFLQTRRNTINLRANVRKAFVSAHKSEFQVPRKPRSERGDPSRAVPLTGHNVTGRKPYPHQEEAWKRLDEFTSHWGARGSIVLPTGAGKTDTVAIWLLQQMEADPALRVLWITHQQELIEQAVRRFQDLARTLPEEFSRRARRIHSNASSSTTLADDSMALAAITFQTVQRVRTTRGNSLDEFLSRPTIVVVDEAHHAGSPTYDELLTRLEANPKVKAIIGLTATPYPTSTAAHLRFRQHFPEHIIEASRESLTEKGILARPTLAIVNTGTRIILTASERTAAVNSDLQLASLKKLDQLQRNEIIVSTWKQKSEHWGKTLVFATSIAHADKLGEQFNDSNVPVKVLHSRSEESTETILEWFSTRKKPCVLISVGMLTEGVDLPDARTAFLARPTASRILMQQMIGRVLRGPRAGGESMAHVVYLRDQWLNFGDLIEPGDIIPELPDPPDSGNGSDISPLPKIILDDSGIEIPPSAQREIQRLFDTWRNSANLYDDDPTNDRSPDPLLTASHLCGYYELPSRCLPVFDHQQAALRRLLDDCLNYDLKGYPFLSYFDELPPPYPTQRTLKELVEYTRETNEAPPFVELNSAINADVAAEKIIQAGSLTADQRARITREIFNSGLARVTYPSLEHFEQAVDSKIRDLLASKPRFTPERRLEQVPRSSEKLPRYKRDLKPICEMTIDTARRILDPEHAERLTDVPEPEWTSKVVGSTWAHWTIDTHGQNAGRQRIYVNRMLRTRRKEVPDEALAYLIYHELLHHLLPGQAHDAEFRRLEALWPDSGRWDLFFDTLHEKWDTRPARYR